MATFIAGASLYTVLVHPVYVGRPLHLHAPTSVARLGRPDTERAMAGTFTAVKNLYLSDEFAPRIAPALRELVGGRTTEVLPALQNIFLEGYESSGPVEEDIGHLVSARQAGGHPIAISSWADSKKEKITQYYFYS